MTWFRVDDTLPFDPQVLAAGNAAMGLWVRAGAWCMQQLTDGHVPDAIVTSMGGRTAAKALERAGLWARSGAGWQFVEWDQPTRAIVEADRAKERDKKRRQRAAGGELVDHDSTTGRFVSPGDNRRDSPPDTRGESPATRPVPSRPVTESPTVVVKELTRDLDDDELRSAIVKARAHRLGQTNPRPGWCRSVAASIDVRRARELANEGRTAAEIDLGLDQRHTPHTATPPPGPAQPAPWTPRIVADAVDASTGIQRASSLRVLTGGAIEA